MMRCTLKTCILLAGSSEIKGSKTKSVKKNLERRLTLWAAGDIFTLMLEARALQKISRSKHNHLVDTVSGKFRHSIKHHCFNQMHMLQPEKSAICKVTPFFFLQFYICSPSYLITRTCQSRKTIHYTFLEKLWYLLGNVRRRIANKVRRC
ncbi:hypothetical protein GJ496_000389 [Pomphorhynchus laevis]|nr:hypothetical protein GJ496_000389 [Pomphorhynchus laevis]